MSEIRDPDETLRDLGRFVVDEASLSDLMLRIAGAAQALIPPVAEASITFANGDGHGWTAGTTGDLALRLDEAQYSLGSGPCLDAATGGVTLHVRDFTVDDRWPSFASIVVESGVRSSLSVPIPIQQHVVAGLNLYSREPDPFGAREVEIAEDVASRAAVAVANAVLYESASQLAVQLRSAMASRATIEQAKGILMANSRCTPEEAFELLVRASQRENRKLRDIATELVERNSRATEASR